MNTKVSSEVPSIPLGRRRSRSLSSSEEAIWLDRDLLARKSYPPPSGYDLDRLNYHISLQDFGSGLQKAANAVFSSDRNSRYTNVDVILLSWEDEDPNLPVSIEIKDLAKTFTEIYGFDVEEWLIPARNSHNRLQTKVLHFLGSGDPKHLKIVYYAGHGYLTNHGQLAWTR